MDGLTEMLLAVIPKLRDILIRVAKSIIDALEKYVVLRILASSVVRSARGRVRRPGRVAHEPSRSRHVKGGGKDVADNLRATALVRVRSGAR